MKQSNRKYMKRKYDALRIRFALLGLFSIALSGPAIAGPGEMGMGKSMKTPCEQPMTKEMQMKGMDSQDTGKGSGEAGQGMSKSMETPCEQPMTKGMQMKGMHSPDSGSGSGEADQEMEMKHGGNQGGMETQGK
ncbi:hypothetical protein [Methylobacter sp. BBA5.1]|jgi:hypothetical protein|uniref:hypothetical protein n=1 Tax=Methylobacter sp. BBA5.1 TaxID=1495064 RepID=UPI00055C2059|nr:hypothetical protein [Methylobacter sp. BBA5.1]